jgi:hypothetical protein
MSRLFSALLLMAALAGCSSSSQQISYTQRCRPQVAFVPVINGTNASLPWDVERELTDDILDHVMCGGLYWVSPLNQFQTAIEQTKGKDYFGADLSFANHFSHNDFLVIAELIEHDMKPYDRYEYPELATPRHISDRLKVLEVAARIRVLDLRYETPVIVRQEVVESRMLLSAKEGEAVAIQDGPSCPEYMGTPFAKCHQELAGMIADKMEEAIFCSW